MKYNIRYEKFFKGCTAVSPAETVKVLIKS
jgi:hypothetical protein